ncbi:MAG: alpha/beta fold hydrolase [Solirubrobacteraceae bacterium]|nr:alpha/beta fold hydrolase [Solirubrobacteraceae bacterium]
MNEQFCDLGDVKLCYETFGDPADPTLLLIMGLGTQMVGWHEDFCRELAGHGFHVVRFDNRDIGRSSRVKGAPPTAAQLLLRSPKAGRYRLEDMAADAVGLLDHLGVDSAHVVGASMGGMIAQELAARHPDRVRSLASIMSTTGNRFKGQPHLKLYPLFLKRSPTDRDGYVEHIARVFKAIGSPGFDRDVDEIREVARTSYDRGHDPAGGARQLGAIVASGDRTASVRRITAPTVVIHGTRDRLVNPSGGRATARAIPGARLVTVDGMGHDLPRGAWPRIIEAIVQNAEAAERADSAAGARAA